MNTLALIGKQTDRVELPLRPILTNEEQTVKGATAPKPHIHEHSVVYANTDILEYGIRRGEVGTISHIYGGVSDMYEVEFSSLCRGKLTIAVKQENLTLTPIFLPLEEVRVLAIEENLLAKTIFQLTEDKNFYYVRRNESREAMDGFNKTSELIDQLKAIHEPK